MSAGGAQDDEERRPIAFISHHSSQVETARQLKRVLANNGVDGWMAPDDIDPGRPFDQAIIEQVRRSDLIILLFCARSDQSRHVKRELMMAENGDKLIFPVRLENIDAEGLAYWLNDYQWIDWFDRRDDSIQRMIDTIKRLVAADLAGRQQEPPPSESRDTAPLASEPVTPEVPAIEDEADAVAMPPEPSPPLSDMPEPGAPSDPIVDADGDDAAPEPDDARGLKVAPVASAEGQAAAEQRDEDDGGKGRIILYVALAALALVAIVLAIIFWPTGDTARESEPGILSPSVDCADTEIPSHAIICSDIVLRERETDLSGRYQAALEQLDGRDRVALQQGHAAFLARRDECRSAACVGTVYDAREGELAEFAVIEEETPEDTAETAPSPEMEADGPTVSDVRSPDPSAPATVTQQPSREAETAPSEPERRSAPQSDPPRQPRTTPPQPIGNPGSWVRAGDYPSNILRNGEEGTSRYQVRVGANGVPTACFTIGSSGHFQLDARACNMVMNRARFRPARDASGNAVAGLYAGSHRWRAPR